MADSTQLLLIVAIIGAGALYFMRSKPVPKRPSGVVKKDGEAPKPAAAAAASEPSLVPVSIYFGSQTGTAEGFSKTLVDESKSHGFNAKMIDLEEFDADALRSDQYCVFLMATFGEGDPTDNAVDFIKWLADTPARSIDKDGGKPTFAGTKFAVFGLGNRQYEHFNSMGVLMDSRCEALGGSRVLPLGVGDDDGTLDEDFEAWKALFWPAMRVAAGLDEAKPSLSEDKAESKSAAAGTAVRKVTLPTAKFTVVDAPAGTAAVSSGRGNIPHGFKIANTSKHFFEACDAVVTSAVNLYQDQKSGGATLHVEMTLPAKTSTGDEDMDYATADNLAVCVDNHSELVDRVLSLQSSCLGDGSRIFSLVPAGDGKKEILFPQPTSVRMALTRYLDLSSVPRKGLLTELSKYAGSESESARLALLGSPQGKSEFDQYITQPSRCIVDVLSDFPTVQIPLEHIFTMGIPRMQPRLYTMSSCPAVVGRGDGGGRKAAITISILGKRSLHGLPRQGLCSKLMMDMHDKVAAGSTVRVFVRQSTFRLPCDVSTPILMVGPGAGIAPFRAFIQDRQLQASQGKAVGPAWLFFGCRRSDEDYLYKSELESAVSAGGLDRLETAFSREGPNKVYVQHKIRDAAADVWDMIYEKKAYFYVCGATGMGRDVLATLKDIAIRNLGDVEGEAWFKSFSSPSQGRYVAELWG